jgi:hypothetical protein
MYGKLGYVCGGGSGGGSGGGGGVENQWVLFP